jgi:hypothetical protein
MTHQYVLFPISREFRQVLRYGDVEIDLAL